MRYTMHLDAVHLNHIDALNKSIIIQSNLYVIDLIGIDAWA